MWQPAQSRCLNFAEQAQAIKAFSHTLDPEPSLTLAKTGRSWTSGDP